VRGGRRLLYHRKLSTVADGRQCRKGGGGFTAVRGIESLRQRLQVPKNRGLFGLGVRGRALSWSLWGPGRKEALAMNGSLGKNMGDEARVEQEKFPASA